MYMVRTMLAVSNTPTKPALILAPMDGITDPPFRQAVEELFGGFDYMATGFLRVSRVAPLSSAQIRAQIGDWFLADPQRLKRTILQILASPSNTLASSVERIAQGGVRWLDLNAGCPSKKVNAHQAGAYLLQDLAGLKQVVAAIRSNFPHFFSVKIRLGDRDDQNFSQILKIIEGEGADAITVHCRTRRQLYGGTANWDYLREAVNCCKIPIIASGDIFTPDDISAVVAETGCHSVMCARGAVRTPWIARCSRDSSFDLTPKQLVSYRYQLLIKVNRLMESEKVSERGRLARLKGLASYLWDRPELEEQRRTILRSKKMGDLWELIFSP